MVPSRNHDNTLAKLELALDSPLSSAEVRVFISDNRGQVHASLCSIGPNGELIVPQGISLNSIGALPELKHQSGVYIITLEDTSDAYIGSTLDHSVRINTHRGMGNRNLYLTKPHRLYSSIRKLGPDVFTYSVIHPSTNFLTPRLRRGPGVGFMKLIPGPL